MQAQFIWSDKKGEGRNSYVAFRRKFFCSTPVSKAIFNIFADSAYNLFINGKFVNFGPARFVPAFPEYDTYDIREMLVEGINSIAVLVNYFGVKTYKSIENKAGFIAWGEILLENNEKIPLDTGSTDWKAFAIIIDLGKTCLFRIGLDVEGVKDTIVDISFSERLRQRKLLLYLHHNYHASLRTVFSDDIEHTTHSVQANFMAVLADMPAKNQLPKVRDYLDKTLKNFFINGYDASEGDLVSPSYAFYMFEALYKLGLVERAEELMSKGWGLMLSDGLKTCREYFARHHDSFCHAWSAHPVYFLSRNVLGVSYPDAPDFSKVIIDVQTSRVSCAEGTYPHPDGIIYVKWHLDKNGERSFEVKAPKGVQILFRSVKDKIKLSCPGEAFYRGREFSNLSDIGIDASNQVLNVSDSGYNFAYN